MTIAQAVRAVVKCGVLERAVAGLSMNIWEYGL